MKKLFFTAVIGIISLMPVFAAQAETNSFWTKILNLFRKPAPVQEQVISPEPVYPIPTTLKVPVSVPVPIKAPAKVLPKVSVPIPTKTPSAVETATTTATTTESVATSTASSIEPSPEPVFLSPGSISFVVSSPASSAKSGTLTVSPRTRITIWWEVPNNAHECTNTWGYPFINANNSQKTGTDVFPDTTTVYSISCVNENNEILDTESVKVEVVPLTGANIGILPILNMWELLKTLFVVSPLSFVAAEALSNVNNENIFDSELSLDVKVNGLDGPVTINAGDKITISWTSEGAYRCRSVWSKNDIAKSGTITGRLSKSLTSVTIRAACIDENKNRVDDAVVVNVKDKQPVITTNKVCPPKFSAQEDIPLPERIVIAVEIETTIKYPDWKIRAQEVVDFINAVLAKNTKKKYEIGKFTTFSLSQYSTLGWNPDYHIDNGYGGTTLFWYVHPKEGPAKEIIGSYVNAMSSDNINGKNFYNLWIVENEAGAVMRGKESLSIDPNLQGPETFSRNMYIFMHELGHSLGLAYGEWYSYKFDDQTGITPNLGTYDFNELYPYEPMTLGKAGKYQYSDFSSYIINKNLNHQYSAFDISRFFSPSVVVRVKDERGNPISGASVEVFGAQKNCFYCKKLINTDVPLQTVLTDFRGEASIDNINPDFNLNETETTGWIAKIIKVSYGGRNAGTVFKLLDAQMSCLLKGSDIHYIDITLY